jgi:hypothetical protein
MIVGDRVAPIQLDLIRFIVSPLICLAALGAVVDRDIQIPASVARPLSIEASEPPEERPLATRSTTASGRSADARPGRSGRASG